MKLNELCPCADNIKEKISDKETESITLCCPKIVDERTEISQQKNQTILSDNINETFEEVFQKMNCQN